MRSLNSLDALGAKVAPVATPQRAAAVVDGQLAKCESELADWVNCASAKTPAGRAKIQALSTQIAKLKAHAEQAEQVQAATQPKADPLRYDGRGAKLNLQA